MMKKIQTLVILSILRLNEKTTYKNLHFNVLAYKLNKMLLFCCAWRMRSTIICSYFREALTNLICCLCRVSLRQKFIVLRHYRRSERTTTNYKRLLLLIALLRSTHKMYHRPAPPLHIEFCSVCFNSILFSKRSFLVQIKVWLIRSKTSGQMYLCRSI